MLDIGGDRWFLKTLLSSYCSFKLDIPEEEAASIPEMHHKYICWNMYLVPSSFAAKSQGVAPLRLLRSSTSTSLAYSQRMQKLNVNGNITGYFNESWSESEICKCALDPKKLFTDEQYTYLTNEKENVTFTVRLEIRNQLLLYKTPAPSPISDKERRTLILSQRENGVLKKQIGQLVKENELLQLSNPQSAAVKPTYVKYTSNFAWRFMKLAAEGKTFSTLKLISRQLIKFYYLT